MKTQFTVHYGDWITYRINGDTLERFDVVSGEYPSENWDYIPTAVKIGAEMVLVSRENVSPNNIRSGQIKTEYWLSVGPVGGNSSPDIKRYHGWRGTTNDRAIYAHGLRKVLKMRELKNGQIAVTVGQDLYPEEQ